MPIKMPGHLGPSCHRDIRAQTFHQMHQRILYRENNMCLRSRSQLDITAELDGVAEALLGMNEKRSPPHVSPAKPYGLFVGQCFDWTVVFAGAPFIEWPTL